MNSLRSSLIRDKKRGREEDELRDLLEEEAGEGEEMEEAGEDEEMEEEEESEEEEEEENKINRRRR